ncbi:MAG: hypothetical protein KF768_07830 [Phycisphaeraceae bacterium]|nr:hypothetical protein [Phycisphaeraceae bacterium]
MHDEPEHAHATDPPPALDARSGEADAGAAAATPASRLGRALGGDLKCIVCGYNLKGISIRGRCPECGVRIRATILAIVDPLANELRPIRHRRLVAIGLASWSVFALLATLISWVPHVSDALAWTGWVPTTQWPISGPILVLVLLVGLSALAFSRPHAGVPVRTTAMCVLGSLLCVPLAWCLGEIHTIAQAPRAWSYVHGWRPIPRESALGVGSALLVAAIILLHRPAIRLLVARCLVMRTGRVDRQTLYAMAAAAAVIALGHFLGGWAANMTARPLTAPGTAHPDLIPQVVRTLGMTLIVFGSLLLTLGFIGGIADSFRIASAVLIPSPTLSAVIRRGHDPGSAIMALAPRRSPSQPTDPNPPPAP